MKPTDARAERFAALYRGGQPLRQIGAAHGLTGERVRQIIAALGLTGADRSRPPTVRQVYAAAVAQRVMRRWGVTRAEYDAIGAKYGRYGEGCRNPFCRYVHQRQNANRRGIAWKFNFAQWWDIWERSGKWERCGRGHGYCMARYGDIGPYAPDNVYICTGAQHSSDGFNIDKPNRPRARRLPIKAIAYQIKSGKRWMVHVPKISGPKKYFGGFETREAAEAHGLSLLRAA